MLYYSGIPSILKDYGLLIALCSLKKNPHQDLFITSEENLFPAHCGTQPVFYLRELFLGE
jgi:hypothetical protein